MSESPLRRGAGKGPLLPGPPPSPSRSQAGKLESRKGTSRPSGWLQGRVLPTARARASAALCFSLAPQSGCPLGL